MAVNPVVNHLLVDVADSDCDFRVAHGFDVLSVLPGTGAGFPTGSPLLRRSVFGDDGAGVGVGDGPGIGLGFTTSPGLFDVERVAIG
jgi:hypothetical protein